MRSAQVAIAAAGVAAVVAGTPNTCQPRSAHPFMPIYHIIGNVTTNTVGEVTNVESINDVSSVFFYKGIYHVFHQCCQNHWDHVVSRDLIHWTRLPPPVVPNMNPTGVPNPAWYDAHGSWDGSLSIPNDWNGLTEPLIVMTAVEGTPPGKAESKNEFRPVYTPRVRRGKTVGGGRERMAMGMAVVRATNASDPFLLSWTKDAANPINYTSGAINSPYDTPGQVWKNGDHWNFLNMGARYTTTDPNLHTWGAAPGPWPRGEYGGEWFSKLANLRDGSPPPGNAPGWMINIGGGNRYTLGDYNSTNESWTSLVQEVTIEYGPNDNWMVGQFAGNRFMNIGWTVGGPPMMTDDAPLSRTFAKTRTPATDGAGGNLHTPPDAPTPFCGETTSWEVFPGLTNIWDRVPSPTNITHGTLHFIGLFNSTDECFAAVNASKDGPFHSFTYNDATIKAPYGLHCWADTSFTWQNRGPFPGQVSGRGPGFPQYPPAPPLPQFTHDHLTGLREVAYDPTLNTLVSNPIRELVGLRTGVLVSESSVTLTPTTPHVVGGTGGPADASTADVLVNFTVPTVDQALAAVGVTVLANVTAGIPVGGVQTLVNFSSPNTNGTILAKATVQTVNPCGGIAGSATATFPILAGEHTVDARVLVDRSIVEVFVMGGRAVFTKTFIPSPLYVPDTHVVLEAWGSEGKAAIEVHSMGCGWTDPPYQPNPTLESLAPKS